MKKYLTGLIVGIIVFSTLAFQAPRGSKKVSYKGKAYLADGTGSGKISKRAFDSLLNFSLIARDSQNKEHLVSQYVFTYAERAVYEDSTGKLQIMTDYYSIESDKGKLPEYWLRSLKERTKAGDTAIYSEIISNYSDTQRTKFYVPPLKLIITD
jgi:hypothetical protein